MTRFAMVALALAGSAAAQAAQQLKFDYKFPGASPAEYHITLSPGGAATFDEPENDKQDAFHNEFQVAPERAAQAFQTAHALNDLQGQFEYTKHRVADTGEKRLTLVNGATSNTAVYHFTENAQLQQLTHWLQGVALTQDFARQVKFDRRFDKLALDLDTKSFTDAVKSGQAAEVQSVRPLLEDLANDVSIMKIARERCAELLRNQR